MRRCHYRATVAPAAPEERGTGGTMGAGCLGNDLDADGRCQAFCFPVKGGSEIPVLKRSLEERHQHLLGKQMERAEQREAATGSQA